MEALLFYSNNCNICKQLGQFKTFKDINKICIDSAKVRKKLPSYITSVPTILIKGQNSQLIKNNDVFKWFQMVDNSGIPMKTSNNTQQDNTQQNNTQQNNATSSGDGLMNNYFSDDSFSSTFSSLDNFKSSGFESGNFANINMDNNEVEYNNNNISKNDANTDEFDKKLNAMMAERNNIK